MPEISDLMEEELLEILAQLTPRDVDLLTRFVEALKNGEDTSRFYEGKVAVE